MALSSKLIVLTAFLTCIVSVKAESHAKSPYQVLDQYRQMLNDGELLTDDGRRKAALLFELPASLPVDSSFQVTTEHLVRPRTNDQFRANEERLKIDENSVDLSGSVDDHLRFHPARVDPEVEGTVFVYDLVFTDKYWSFGVDGKPSAITIGPKQWKIAGSLTIRQTARKAAIRYVREQKNNSTDPSIRRNADETVKPLDEPTFRNHL